MASRGSSTWSRWATSRNHRPVVSSSSSINKGETRNEEAVRSLVDAVPAGGSAGPDGRQRDGGERGRRDPGDLLSDDHRHRYRHLLGRADVVRHGRRHLLPDGLGHGHGYVVADGHRHDPAARQVVSFPAAHKRGGARRMGAFLFCRRPYDTGVSTSRRNSPAAARNSFVHSWPPVKTTGRTSTRLRRSSSTSCSILAASYHSSLLPRPSSTGGKPERSRLSSSGGTSPPSTTTPLHGWPLPAAAR